MDSKLLLDSISILSSSRVGISALRSLLNSLAIRGKLNNDCSSDCNIDNLISELEMCKSRFLEQTGRLIKKKISGHDIPALGFDLPSNWCLASLDQLCFAQAGFAFSAANFNSDGKGLPLIRIRDIDRGFSETFYSGEYRPEFLVQKGDWLIGMDGNFNVRQWKGESALLNQRVTRLIFFDDRINQKFISLALEEHLHSLMGTKSYTTVDHLSTKQIDSTPIPLPCIEVQNRIISQLDDLATQIDELDKYQESMRRLGLAARKSAVDAISTAQTADELQVAWERIQNHWEVIAGTPESIDLMKTLILDLAVRGDLVTMNNSKAAEVIKWTNSELKLDDSKLWSLPTLHKEKRVSWNRIPLAKLGTWGSGGTPTSTRREFYQNGTIPWAVIGDMNNEIMTRTETRITEKALLESSSKLVPVGAILIAMYGASIGKTAITGIECCTNQAIAHCVVDTKIVSKEYFFIVAKSLKRHLIQEGKGAAQPNISQSVLKHLVIDLPPLDEQEKIVERVYELLQLCDQLEVALREAEILAEKFAGSVVSASA